MKNGQLLTIQKQFSLRSSAAFSGVAILSDKSGDLLSFAIGLRKFMAREFLCDVSEEPANIGKGSTAYSRLIYCQKRFSRVT